MGVFVCGNISVLCDWYINYILLPIPGFFSLELAVTFLVGNWSSCVILGHMYIMSIWHSIGISLNCLIYFSIILSVTSRSSVSFVFKDRWVSVFPSVSCSHRGCHSCLSIATASCSNQFGPRVRKTVNSFTFPRIWSCILLIQLFPIAFYFRKPVSSC